MSNDNQSWQEPYLQWQRERERNPGVLSPDLDLDTIAGCREWLSHPSNWMRTELFIIRFEGLLPKISSFHAWKLAPDCGEAKGMIEVVISERRNRRYKPKEDNNESVFEE